jgi:hypothetical protein
MTEALLLLVGGSAVALAPRLLASGYSTVDLTNLEFTDWAGLTNQGPVAAVLAADQRHAFHCCVIVLPACRFCSIWWSTAWMLALNSCKPVRMIFGCLGVPPAIY